MFPSPSEKATSSKLTARPGVAASLRCPSEGPERDGGTGLCPRQQKTTRHPAGCGFNPLKGHSERGYRWSCTEEKQIMSQQEASQPPSGLSADQSAVGGWGGSFPPHILSSLELLFLIPHYGSLMKHIQNTDGTKAAGRHSHLC